MKLANIKLVEEIMTRIEHVRAHQAAIDAMTHYIYQRKPNKKLDLRDLKEALYQEEMDEWRNLLLWGITLSNNERDRIKAAAYQRFLSDGMHVANWLNNGESPGMWLSADEDAFREMAKKVFGSMTIKEDINEN